jgi:uncharacterized DUF497 family protein
MHPSEWEFIEWDEHNAAHVASHSMSSTEVRQVLLNDPVWRRDKEDQSGDWIAVGETDGGRQLLVVVAVDEVRRAIRPITGWEVKR